MVFLDHVNLTGDWIALIQYGTSVATAAWKGGNAVLKRAGVCISHPRYSLEILYRMIGGSQFVMFQGAWVEFFLIFSPETVDVLMIWIISEQNFGQTGPVVASIKGFQFRLKTYLIMVKSVKSYYGGWRVVFFLIKFLLMCCHVEKLLENS